MKKFFNKILNLLIIPIAFVPAVIGAIKEVIKEEINVSKFLKEYENE